MTLSSSEACCAATSECIRSSCKEEEDSSSDRRFCNSLACDSVNSATFFFIAWNDDSSSSERRRSISSLWDDTNCSNWSDCDESATVIISDLTFSISAAWFCFISDVMRSISEAWCSAASDCTRFSSSAASDSISLRTDRASVWCDEVNSSIFFSVDDCNSSNCAFDCSAIDRKESTSVCSVATASSFPFSASPRAFALSSLRVWTFSAAAFLILFASCKAFAAFSSEVFRPTRTCSSSLFFASTSIELSLISFISSSRPLILASYSDVNVDWRLFISSLWEAASCSSCSDWDESAKAIISDFTFAISATWLSLSWFRAPSTTDKWSCSASVRTRSRSLAAAALRFSSSSTFFSTADSSPESSCSNSCLWEAACCSSCSDCDELAIAIISDLTFSISVAWLSFNARFAVSTTEARSCSASIRTRSSSPAADDSSSFLTLSNSTACAEESSSTFFSIVWDNEASSS